MNQSRPPGFNRNLYFARFISNVQIVTSLSHFFSFHFPTVFLRFPLQSQQHLINLIIN